MIGRSATACGITKEDKTASVSDYLATVHMLAFPAIKRYHFARVPAIQEVTKGRRPHKAEFSSRSIVSKIAFNWNSISA